MPNSLDYAYANPLPGSIGTSNRGTIPDSVVIAGGVTPPAAPFQDAVSSPTESSFGDQNPAWHGESALQDQQEEGIRDPETPDAAGAADADNPVTNENRGDVEADLVGEGLGDAGAGVRTGTLAHPSS